MVKTVTKISLNAQHLAKPAISVVGAITLCLYVAKFLTGDPCSDLSQGRQTSVNELNQDCDNSLTSISKNTEHRNRTNMVPKQVLDVVNFCLLLSTSSQSQEPVQLTQIFSNIEINGVLVRGKQDTGAEINTAIKCI